MRVNGFRLSIVFLGAAAVAASWVSRPAAQLPSVSGSVTILRDKWGVPHIFQKDAPTPEENDERGAFAAGYAQAQDRLFQMEILRRAGKGRLAELIGDAEALQGKSAIDFDISVRRELYTEPERQDLFAKLSPPDQAAFRAYVDGVNLFIAEALANPLRKLPSEYLALGILPQPWSVTDSIAFAAVGIGIFGAEGGHEVENASLLLDLMDRFPSDENAAKGIFNDLFWIEDPDAPVTIAGDPVTDPNLGSITRFADAQMDLLEDSAIRAAIRKAARAAHDEQAAIDEIARRLGLSGLFAAGHSNALVVSGELTTTGHPMLGGGPQTGYSTPSFFWEAGLHSLTYDSVGVNVPLGPGNIMGRTETLAYTVTSGIDDQIDTYVEILNPKNSRQYQFNGLWTDMNCRTETFLVRINPTDVPDADRFQEDPTFLLGLSPADPLRPRPALRPVVQELCRTVHGPVFFIDLENHVAFSHRKAHWGEEMNAAATWLGLGRKKTLEEVETALDGFAFTFNFNYASTDGRIAYFHRGRIPLRPVGTDPRLPLPGDGSAEWRRIDGKDFVAASDLGSTIIDPEQGYIANWNNKPIHGWGGAGEARELWGTRHRVEGITREVERLIQGNGEISLNEQDSLDGTTAPSCFSQSDYQTAEGPLGCVTSINGIIRKAATSDIHALTVLPFLEKAASVEGVGATESQAIALLRAWVDAGAPLLRPAGKDTYDFPGIAIYRDWRSRLQSNTFNDDLGGAAIGLDYPSVIEGNMEDDHGGFLTPDGLLYHVLTHAPELDGAAPQTTLTPSRNYCDRTSTSEAETCAELLVSTLTETIGALAARFGSPDPADWLEPVIVSTVPAQGAAPEITLERMNRGSWNQLHDFGTGRGFRTFNVVPPGQSGAIDLQTLAESQTADDPRAAVDAGNPHVFDQVDLYQGWTFKPFVHYQDEIQPPIIPQTVPYVRGVIPQPDTAVLRNIWRRIDQAGISLPSFTLFGEVATE